VVRTLQSRLLLSLEVQLTIATLVCFYMDFVLGSLASFTLSLTRKETYLAACVLDLLLILSSIFTSAFRRKHFASGNIGKRQTGRYLNVVLLQISLNVTIQLTFSLDVYDLSLGPIGGQVGGGSLFSLSFARNNFIIYFHFRHYRSWR
jgi:hypothetical protein